MKYSVLFSRRKYTRYFSSKIDKVLIANRGEIACRIIRSARKLGIKTVAVFSDADANAMHVYMANEAYYIGPSPSQESYLRGEKLLQIAKESNSKAVHPGYGFLSENTEFAIECEKAGIRFIGPPATAIRDMGIKSKSKAIMIGAGVPTIQGYHGEDQSDEHLLNESERIGFPVMLKAVRGGGGKGMRVARSKEDFHMQLESARSEALKAFGNCDMLIEKFVENPRHVEVQIFGDTHGNYVYLLERDCSVQRRHQKVIEEAPAPGISTELRTKLGLAATQAARAVGYVGAGTVEFILDKDTHEYYFMEMNTRLQVEHPVTEMITNTDLVEWQFKVANGEKLPLTQDDITLNGHAFEARIYAEDSNQNFLPRAGHLEYLNTPSESYDVRVETGVKQGDEISVYYDPMIAKLVVWGNDRQEALLKLIEKLTQFNVAGLPTNINFLLTLARHGEFRKGNVHTNFIPLYKSELFEETEWTRDIIAFTVLAQLFTEESYNLKISPKSDPFVSEYAFRLNHNLVRNLSYKLNENTELKVKVTFRRYKVFQISYNIANKETGEKNEGEFLVKGTYIQNKNHLHIECSVDNLVSKSMVYVNDSQIHIFSQVGHFEITIPEPSYMKNTKPTESTGSALSPMPGVVDKVFVKKDELVKTGQPLLSIIAMKMEYIIKSPKDGKIEDVPHSVGEPVAKNAVLVKFAE